MAGGKPREEQPRVIVTGAGGFVGPHLMAHLEGSGIAAVASKLRLPDRRGFARLVADEKPDAVVHLAAVSFLPDAQRDPIAAYATNVEGPRSVLEALGEADPEGRARMIYVSSGHVYRSAGENPIDESFPVDPQSIYGSTKLAGEIVCRIHCQAAPARPLVIFRPFNHTGPGQRPSFAAPSFARQTARIEAGRQEPVLYTGDLSVRRDFCDVRDVVRAYALAIRGDVPPGTYNLASGRAPSLQEIAEHYRSRSKVPFEILPRIEPGRRSETREIRGSAERIREAAGWRAEIPLEKTLDDLLEEWRSRVARGQDGVEEGRPGSGEDEKETDR